MGVVSKRPFTASEPLWVEFSFIQDTGAMLFGKRSRARLKRMFFDATNRCFVMGFQFLSLTEFQMYIIESAIEK